MRSEFSIKITEIPKIGIFLYGIRCITLCICFTESRLNMTIQYEIREVVDSRTSGRDRACFRCNLLNNDSLNHNGNVPHSEWKCLPYGSLQPSLILPYVCNLRNLFIGLMYLICAISALVFVLLSLLVMYPSDATPIDIKLALL